MKNNYNESKSACQNANSRQAFAHVISKMAFSAFRNVFEYNAVEWYTIIFMLYLGILNRFVFG